MKDVISAASVDTTSAQRTTPGSSNRKPSSTSPWHAHLLLGDGSALLGATVLKDRATVLRAPLTSKSDLEGLVWMDLPGGDELIATLYEMGFSAMQRIHLRKMLWRKRVVPAWH